MACSIDCEFCANSRELREVAAPGAGLAFGTLLAFALLYKDVSVSSASAFDLPYAVRPTQQMGGSKNNE